jgi:hypothetical protein
MYSEVFGLKQKNTCLKFRRNARIHWMPITIPSVVETAIGAKSTSNHPYHLAELRMDAVAQQETARLRV